MCPPNSLLLLPLWRRCPWVGNKSPKPQTWLVKESQISTCEVWCMVTCGYDWSSVLDTNLHDLNSSGKSPQKVLRGRANILQFKPRDIARLCEKQKKESFFFPFIHPENVGRITLFNECWHLGSSIFVCIIDVVLSFVVKIKWHHEYEGCDFWHKVITQHHSLDPSFSCKSCDTLF